MCCRLKMDLRELRKKTGGLFGAGDLTGSIGVVTLNLPKLAYLAQGEQDFLDLVAEYAEMAKESLEFKRKLINDNLERGMFPWSRRYLKNGFAGHFATIGILGGHEACLNLLGKGIETPAGTRLMKQVLNHLQELTSRFQEETGNLYNLEATPAEGTSYRLAKIDKGLYADIQASGNGTPYYTNSTLLPVDFTSDIFQALEHQDELQPLYTGGTVFHTFLGEAAADAKALKHFIVKAFSETKIPFLSITPTFSVCKDHGYIQGEHFDCPTCGEEAEVYTRIVGYYRPVSRWNKGKQEEYQDRLTYCDPCSR
jgi:ribonucleoside-triphosphate reductase